MLTGLLVTLDILVCVALIGVVLLQRSEGGAFGMGGGPTGLITTRGAGDLLTRSTWVLFSLFLVISLGLTLLGEHDRASSGVIQKLKLQQINPNTLSQPAPTPPSPAPTGAPLGGETTPSPLGAPSPFLVPAPQASVPATVPPATTPKPTARAAKPGPKPATAKPTTPAAATPAPAAAAPAQAAPPPPVLVAPPPQPAPVQAAPQPQANPNAPVSTGTP